MALNKISAYIIVMCILLAGCNGNAVLPDLKETYSYKDTRPFGASVAYALLQKSYPGEKIQVKKRSLSETISWTSDTASLYINISRKFYIRNTDAEALLDYVYKGNTAFIAASEIDTILLEKIYCREKEFEDIIRMFPMLWVPTHVSLVPAITSSSDTAHNYYYYPFTNYFSEINNNYGRIAGYNQLRQPNFIVFFWGKGRLYLHCDPRAFSNYFLLQRNNYQYWLQPLSILPVLPEHIYWDDYYNKVNYKEGRDTSVLAAIFANPPLKWAFLLVLLLMLLFVLLNSRRRQRTIPVIKPVQNSSVAFAEAIAGLYFAEKNNKSIADKMITYFNEYIRTSFYLNTAMQDTDFLPALSKKAGVPLELTEALYKTMQQLSEAFEVTDKQLLDLNQQIQQFNKYKS